MWLALKALALRWLLRQTVGGLFSFLLVVALPLAGMLKVVGLPILIVLGIIALPLIMVLAVIGLPILLVVGAVSAVTAVVGGLLAAGVALLKVALPVVLVVALAVWLFRKVRKPRPDVPPSTGPEPSI